MVPKTPHPRMDGDDQAEAQLAHLAKQEGLKLRRFKAWDTEGKPIEVLGITRARHAPSEPSEPDSFAEPTSPSDYSRFPHLKAIRPDGSVVNYRRSRNP